MLRLLLILLLALCMASATSAAPRQIKDCAECPAMVAVPGGKFMMGSPKWEPGRFDSEGPQHQVTIRPFALAITGVSDAEFLAFLRETGYQPALCDQILHLGRR